MMLAITEAPGIYCDAHLVTAGRPRFLSLWGRDTAMQNFLARLTLPDSDGGLATFVIGDRRRANAQQVAELDSHRLTELSVRKAGTIFGDLVNLWLYDTLAVEADHANARALLLYRQEDAGCFEKQLWPLLKQTLWLPVLDAWQSTLIERFTAQGWITPLAGFQINARLIDLSAKDEVQATLTRWLRAGDLSLV